MMQTVPMARGGGSHPRLLAYARARVRALYVCAIDTRGYRGGKQARGPGGAGRARVCARAGERGRGNPDAESRASQT